MTLPILLTDVPHLPPFICLRCGAQEGTREYWVDTGIDVEVISHQDGRLYICNVCVGDIVEADPNSYTKTFMDQLVEQFNAQIKHATEIEILWNNQVKVFKEIGIDLEKVWENLNGSGITPNHSELVSSTGANKQLDATESADFVPVDIILPSID